LAINLARNAAKHPVKPTPVGLFSLEMSSGQCVERLTSMETKVPLDCIITGQMDEATLVKLSREAGTKVASIPIFIDDTPGINIFELRGKARTMVRKEKVGLIIIDYLQLMSGVSSDRNQNREQEISTISRNLKGLAKELNVPIIALSQLSRKVEERKDKTPGLADLRESGAIEQDADLVMFMYRPEYYNIDTDHNGESTKGITYLDIAKHRNGALDRITLKANLSIQEFTQETQSVIPLPGVVPRPAWKPVDNDDKPELF
jgi:replicative DNA helicase